MKSKPLAKARATNFSGKTRQHSRKQTRPVTAGTVQGGGSFVFANTLPCLTSPASCFFSRSLCRMLLLPKAFLEEVQGLMAAASWRPAATEGATGWTSQPSERQCREHTRRSR